MSRINLRKYENIILSVSTIHFLEFIHKGISALYRLLLCLISGFRLAVDQICPFCDFEQSRIILPYYVLLRNLPASELLVLTFRKLLPVPFPQELSCMPMKMERLVCSETSALKAQTPRDYPKDTVRHSIHGESLKSRMVLYRRFRRTH
jgi:hypothetical protein